jgi:hypothetical protein
MTIAIMTLEVRDKSELMNEMITFLHRDNLFNSFSFPSSPLHVRPEYFPAQSLQEFASVSSEAGCQGCHLYFHVFKV